jgi:hypothetical protein
VKHGAKDTLKEDKDMTPFEQHLAKTIRRGIEDKMRAFRLPFDEDALSQAIKEKVAREAPYLSKKREEAGVAASEDVEDLDGDGDVNMGGGN